MDGYKRKFSWIGLLLMVLVIFGISFASSPQAKTPFTFEDGNMIGWAKKGKAFGSSPRIDFISHGDSLPDLIGYHGSFLVGSIHGGENGTGELISPAFRLDQAYLTFLIGGGNFPQECEVVLIVGNTIVRRATGKGSNRLSLVKWDVKKYWGKLARIVLRDYVEQNGGHILADDFIMQNS